MAAQEPLASVLNTLHNLAFYLETMRKVREEISADATVTTSAQPTLL
jgi:queuine tRNA-ribosyltransferase